MHSINVSSKLLRIAVIRASIKFTIFFSDYTVRPLNVSIQSVRQKNSFSKKDRPAHFWAKKIKVVTKPILPKSYDKYFPSFYNCRKLLDQQLKMIQKQVNQTYLYY